MVSLGLLGLYLPVRDGGERGNNHEGSFNAYEKEEEKEKEEEEEEEEEEKKEEKEEEEELLGM